MPRARAVPIQSERPPNSIEPGEKAAQSALKTLRSGRTNGVSRDLSRDALKEVLTVAEERGLLSGTRTHVLRGRMPAGLVAEAKLKSGITSDSKLLEAALASLAVADDYAQWLLAQRGTVNPELDLEF